MHILWKWLDAATSEFHSTAAHTTITINIGGFLSAVR